MRTVVEPRKGKGFAYNTGIAHARGKFLMFTDDDVRVSASWIDDICEAMEVTGADAVAGGVALPPSLVQPWMTDMHLMLMASTAQLDRVSPQNLVGANMAIGRWVFERIPGFDPELGPGALGFCDEVLLSMQMKSAGMRIGSALHIEVEHHLDPSRLTPKGFIERARGEGRSLAYIAYHWSHERVTRPHLKLAKRLILARVQRRHCNGIPNSVNAQYLALCRDIAYLQQYLRECKRPRNYAYHGLVKLNGLLPCASPS